MGPGRDSIIVDESPESSSSESTFAEVDSENNSSEAGSDDSYKKGSLKKNSRAHRDDVAVELLDDDDNVNEMVGSGGDNSEDGTKEERDLNGRYRDKGKEPEKKLGWQILYDEWMAELGEATDPDFEVMKSATVPIEQREPPEELLMPLLPYQKEWLAWSMKQEAGSFKGGILADEMGMGKTIQAISLIVADWAVHQPGLNIGINSFLASSSHAAQTSSSETKVLPQIKATLVVCPLVAVSQWYKEISRFTLDGSVKVLVYHGPRRNIDMTTIAEYDIIITTYSIVEVDHRKHVRPPKESCKVCGKLFSVDHVDRHQRKCGGNSVNKAKEQGQDSEEDDLEVKKKPKSAATIKTAKRKTQKPENDSRNQGKRGRRRKIEVDDLQNALAGSLQSIKKRKIEPAGSSVLYSVRWRRIILDEAHYIKDRRSSTAKAIFALQSEYKWALSGTPLQNRIDELFSLIRFVRAHPFSHYFCEQCECEYFQAPSRGPGEKCKCGHYPFEHFGWWNRFVAVPLSGSNYTALDRNALQKAMMLLKHKVLSNLLLRRTKLERTSDLALPPRTAFLRRDAFDLKEQDYYQALYTQSQSEFNTYVAAGTLLNNYAHLFALITRLRQAVNHPYLVVYSATSIEAPSESTAGDDLCGVCHKTPEDSVVTTGCHHKFCRSCIIGYIDAGPGFGSLCPKCATPLKVDFTGKSIKDAEEATAAKTYKRSSILNRINLQNFQSSTKIEAVRMETLRMLQEDPSTKAIIFSQFTSMLDLIGFALEKSGIKSVMLEGSMSKTTRDQMIDQFTNDAETKIFFLSLRAGGVALNLTVASHVFLMDPWWNPAIEQQAQGRVHRLGQHRPVKVIRFVIENTIEDRILKLQETKQLLFEGTVGGSNEAFGRLTQDDMACIGLLRKAREIPRLLQEEAELSFGPLVQD